MAWIWKIKERVKIIYIAIIFNFIMNLILINFIWVYWAALATWIGWILIWWLWEYFLWKNYITNFDIYFFTKNLFFMWLLWIFSYYYIIPIFEWINRLNSLWLLTIYSILWFIIFWIINKKELNFFILEIKKLKKW